MFVLRPVTPNDLTGIAELATRAGPGLSLPKERRYLRLIIEESILSFAKRPLYPGPESYFFVLEECATGQVVGCCAIHAKTGGYIPLYLYEVVDVMRTSPTTRKKRIITRLHPKQIHDGPTELCALYLLPEYRQHKLGRLLSLARFQFIASFRRRFDKTLSALMRPHIGEDGHAPFWEACGEPFFGMDFLEMSRLRYTKPRLLEGLLPRYPIYAGLLPESVQESIGKPHPHTMPAVRMLEREGFEQTNLVDAIDGGPLYLCETAKARAICETVSEPIIKLSNKSPRSHPYVVSTGSLDFRATLASLHRHEEGVVLSHEVAKTLGVRVSDSITYRRSS